MASVIRGTAKTGLKTEELPRSLTAARPPRDSRRREKLRSARLAGGGGWVSQILRDARARRWHPRLFSEIGQEETCTARASPAFTMGVRHAIPELALPVRNGAPRHLIANGLVGEPTAPVMGMAGATNMNS